MSEYRTIDIKAIEILAGDVIALDGGRIKVEVATVIKADWKVTVIDRYSGARHTVEWDAPVWLAA